MLLSISINDENDGKLRLLVDKESVSGMCLDNEKEYHSENLSSVSPVASLIIEFFLFLLFLFSHFLHRKGDSTLSAVYICKVS